MARFTVRFVGNTTTSTGVRPLAATALARPLKLAFLRRLDVTVPNSRADIIENKFLSDDAPLELEAESVAGRSEIHIVCPTSDKDRLSSAVLAEHLRMALVPVTDAPVVLSYGTAIIPKLLQHRPAPVKVRMLFGSDAKTAFFAGPSEISARVAQAIDACRERQVGRLTRLMGASILDRTEESQIDEWDGVTEELSPTGVPLLKKWIPLGKFETPRVRANDGTVGTAGLGGLGVLRPRLTSVRSAEDSRPFANDYLHLLRGLDPTPFQISAATLVEACLRNHMDLTPRKQNHEADRILFGLRGCVLVDPTQDGVFVSSVTLKEVEVDHKNLRCVVGVWVRSTGQICAFTASTVPNAGMVAEQLKQGGRQANLLLTGRYRYYVGTHRDKPGCFQQEGPVVVLRSNDDKVYTLFDLFDSAWVADNIHMAGSASSAVFSSAGCQTIPGHYDTSKPAANGQRHTGKWGVFRKAAGLVADGDRVGCEYAYLLWTGRDLRVIQSEGGAAYGTKLRFGSSAPVVSTLQEKLEITKSGRMDAPTVMKLVTWQRANQGGVADGIVSGQTAAMLGLTLEPGVSTTPVPEPLPRLLTAAQVSQAVTYNQKIPADGDQIQDLRALVNQQGTGVWDEAIILAVAREQDTIGAAVDGKIGRETFTLKPDWAMALGVHSAWNDNRTDVSRGGFVAQRVLNEAAKKTWVVKKGTSEVTFSYNADDGDGYRVWAYEGFKGVAVSAAELSALGVTPAEQAIFWEIAHGESRKKMGAINTWDNQILSYGGVQFSGKAGSLARLVANLQNTEAGRDVYTRVLVPAGITFVPAVGNAAPTLSYTPSGGTAKTEPNAALRAMKQDPVVLGAWMIAGNDAAMQGAQALTWAQRWLRPAVNGQLLGNDGPKIRELVTSQYSVALIAKLATWMPALVKPWMVSFIEEHGMDLYEPNQWNQNWENKFQQWFVASWDKSDLSGYATTLSKVRGTFGAG